jgi:hypothetical protein
MRRYLTGSVRLLCTWALGACLLASAAGQTLDERLVTDAADGRLDEFDFLSACLIASGVTDECELSGWADSWIQRQTAALGRLPAGGPFYRLAALDEGLKQRLLRGQYRTEASDLREALQEGDFNCLSAAALLYAAADAAGLSLQIRLNGGHVSLQYDEANGGRVVIEPASAKAPARQPLEPAGRLLTPVELIAKLYYNRGVELLRDQQFNSGLELLAISLRLDPKDASARANLVAGINNWAASRYAAGDYQQAAALIALGRRLEPDFAPLVANERLVKARLQRP